MQGSSGTLASGYEPGELLATKALQQDDTDQLPSHLKSLWKNLSPTPSRSLTRATTAPGHRLLSHILMIKTSGMWWLARKQSQYNHRQQQLQQSNPPPPLKLNNSLPLQ